VLTDVLGWAAANDLPPLGLVRSPLTGAGGNVEFLVWLRPGAAASSDTAAAIERAMQA